MIRMFVNSSSNALLLTSVLLQRRRIHLDSKFDF